MKRSRTQLLLLAAALLSVSFYLILLFWIKRPEAIYSDSGFSYIELRNFIDSRYSTFAFDYRGSRVDPEHRLLPFELPWISHVGKRLYLQYPPWFILTALPFYLLAGNTGLYLLNFLVLLGILYLTVHFVRAMGGGAIAQALALLLLAFGSTALLYTLFFHEYPLSWLLSGLAAYFAYRSVTEEEGPGRNAMLYGIFAGLATVYRLDLMIALFPLGVHLAFLKKRLRFDLAFAALAGFLIPFSFFLIFNTVVHGHPLSLRYVNNVSTSEIHSLADRIQVIRDLLFSRTKGLFFQSPWIAFVFLAFLFPNVRKDRRLRIPAVWFAVSSALVLAVTPNQGSHFSPRYLFGLLVPVVALGAIALERLLGRREEPEDQSEDPSRRRSSVLRRGSVVMGVILGVAFLVSFHRYRQKLSWVLASDRAVLEADRAMASAPGPIIVLTEYATPQNIQYVFPDRIFVVARSREDFAYLMEHMREKGFSSFAVAYPVLGGVPGALLSQLTGAAVPTETPSETGARPQGHPGSADAGSAVGGREVDAAILDQIPGYPVGAIPARPQSVYLRYPFLFVTYRI